ncbi:MAG: CPBP family intramembrane metalloprotease [Ruminococcaceae bacterium]|nr:CPBP family intramembrane metalloprotease [Oscillospiraceae bacterium]
MKKLFEKHETLFCLGLIALYIVINSLCMQSFGVEDLRTVLINTAFSAALLLLILLLKSASYYGLQAVKAPRRYLYFLPLLLVVSVNLWNGVNINHSAAEIVCHVLTMLNIGFIEEIIFRGFLFRMMAKDNVRVAMAVSSVTFGIGHVVNLLNGADLVPTLFQIAYAASIGYLFVIIFHKSGSLLPCIAAHSLTNALSVFNTENIVSLYIAPVFLIVFPLLYALYIQKSTSERL